MLPLVTRIECVQVRIVNELIDLIFCNFHDKQDRQCFRHYPESHTWLKSYVRMNWYKASLQKHMPAEQHQHSPCIAVKRYEQRGRDPIVKQVLHDAVYHFALLTTALCQQECTIAYSLTRGCNHKNRLDVVSTCRIRRRWYISLYYCIRILFHPAV